MTLDLLLTREDIPEDVKREITKVIDEQKKTEEESIRTKTRLEYLLKSSPAVIYSCEPWGKYQTTYISENVKELIGHEAHEFLYNPDFWIKGIHPDDRQQSVIAIEKIVTKEHFSETYRFKHKNGNWFWMLDEATLIRNDQGKPIEIVGYWSDITPLKQAEEALQKLTLDLRERVKELTCLYEISRLVAESSKSENEVCHHIIELIPPAWQYPEITCVRIIFRGEMYSTDIFQETSWKQSVDIWVSGKKSGSIEVYYLEERPSFYEGPFLKEEKDLLNAIAREIGKYTERKQIEEQFRSERENFYNILNSTDDGIYIVNSTYEFKFINAAFKKEFGPVEEKKCYEYFNEFLEACSWCTMNKILDGNTIRWEKTLPRTQKTYDIIDTPLKNTDGSISLLSILRDITERKQAEEQLQYQANLLEYVSDAVIAADLDFNITSWNKAAEEIYGWQENEVIGKNIAEVTQIEYPYDRGEDVVDKFMNDGIWRGEVIQKRKDGSPINILASVASVKDGTGKSIAALAVNRDITERIQIEETLREREKQYRTLFENIPIGLYRSTPDHKFLAANPTFINQIGVSSFEELCTIDTDKLADQQKYPRDLFKKEIEEKGEVKGLEYHLERLDGSSTYYRENARLIKDSNGSILYYEGSVEDITDRIQVEIALRESEERYRMLFDESPISLWEVDGSNVKNYIDTLIAEGEKNIWRYLNTHPQDITKIASLVKISDINSATLKLYKAERKKDIFQNFTTILGEESFLMFKEMITTLSKEQRVSEIEGINYTLTGKKIHVLLRSTIVPGYEDTFSRIVISVIDITERILMEKALRESEERLRRFMDSATDGFTLFDSNLNFLDMNRAGLEDLELTREQIVGKNIKDIFDNVQETGRFENYLEVIKTGKPYYVDVFSTPRIGQKYYSLRVFKVGEGLGAITTDITERVKAEKTREELEQRRDNFVWMTSHELRTPLTVLTGYCDFLMEHIDDLTQKRITNILGVMKSNLDRLERLTSKVSTVAQIERGIFELVKTTMNLCKFLEDTTEPYQYLLGEQFKFQGCQEDPPVTIDGDPNKLQQVLENIIGNAIKQTDKDHRKIIVSWTIHPTNIKIEVSDNGAGIAPSNLEVIFDQFVSIPTEYSATGTGIGLYLCRKTLEAHGGTINAQSEGSGHGATFIIELPLNSQ